MDSHIASLNENSDWWTYASFATSGIIILGTVLMYLELFKLTASGSLRDRLIEAIGLAIVLVGTSVNLVIQVHVFFINGQILNELNKQIEERKKENLELQKQISPRAIDDEKCVALSVKWKQIGPKTIKIRSYSMDLESAILGRRIGTCLRNAGFTVHEDLMSMSQLGSLMLGVHVFSEDIDLAAALALPLKETAELMTIAESVAKPTNSTALGSNMLSLYDSDVTIFIGLKPI